MVYTEFYHGLGTINPSGSPKTMLKFCVCHGLVGCYSYSNGDGSVALKSQNGEHFTEIL